MALRLISRKVVFSAKVSAKHAAPIGPMSLYARSRLVRLSFFRSIFARNSVDRLTDEVLSFSVGNKSVGGQ